MVFTADASGSCDYVSRQWLEFTGAAESEQMGFGWSELLHPDDRTPALSTWQTAVQRQEDFDFECRVRRRDGSHAWFKMLARPVCYVDGKARRWVGVAVDIDALKEAGRRKDEYLAILAHELRNPLAAISAAATLISRPGVSAENTHYAKEALKQRVSQLARLIDDLLDLTRIARGKIELQRETVDMEAVLARVADSSKSFLDERRQKLSVRILDPLLVHADPVRLEQIITNLLMNASRYSNDGEEVALLALREGTEAVVRVKDEGMGISPALMPKLFEPFARADNSHPGIGGGPGLGLTIAKTLCSLHQGTLTAKSAGEGKGSEFEVRLPLTRITPH